MLQYRIMVENLIREGKSDKQIEAIVKRAMKEDKR